MKTNTHDVETSTNKQSWNDINSDTTRNIKEHHTYSITANSKREINMNFQEQMLGIGIDQIMRLTKTVTFSWSQDSCVVQHFFSKDQ